MNPDEKMDSECEQTKARGEHAHWKDNQTSFDAARCLICTL